MYYDHMSWGWAVLMTIGWVILVGLFVALIVGALRDRSAKQSARELLDRRLAAGEIDLDEYERLRSAMSPRPAGPSGPAGPSTPDPSAPA